jgi:hypothetical protein
MVITAFSPEHVLLAFFGSEPGLLDPGLPWFYNQLTFIVEREGERVTCTIEPAEGQITVEWERHGDKVAGISVTKLRTLDVISEEGASCLVAAREPDTVQLRLWLDPHVRLYVGAN